MLGSVSDREYEREIESVKESESVLGSVSEREYEQEIERRR